VTGESEYALVLIRYLRPLDDIVAHQEAHRSYLRGLEAEGVLLASGPFEPRSGGGLAQYELLPWKPVIGRERLDRL